MISQEQKKTIKDFVQQISEINGVNSNSNLFYSLGMNNSANTLLIKLKRQTNQLIEALMIGDHKEIFKLSKNIEGIILTETSLGQINDNQSADILNKLDILITKFKKD